MTDPMAQVVSAFDRDTVRRYQAIQLLEEARALFNDHPNFALRHDRKATSYKLASRIERFLKEE